MLTTLAARYARALADVVREPAALEKTTEELERLARLADASKELRDFLASPAFPHSRKVGVMEALAKRTKMSAPTARLLKILLKKERFGLLGEIAREFRRIEEQRLNRVSVEVTTAVPLETKTRDRLRASLEKLTGKTVHLAVKVDPDVLGGARARIGSVVFDGSVAGRLDRMRQRLIGER